jgi:hypothetical protein
MKFIQQLILAVTLSIFASTAVAQTAGTEQSTDNLVYTTVNPAPPGAMPHSWTGFSIVNSTGGNTTSDNGAVTGYNVNTGTFMFGYNQGTIAYTYAINQALANSGSGIVVQGYNYSWQINNNNFDNRQSGTDTLTARIITFAPNNIDIRRTDTWTYNTKFDWTTFSGIVNYANPGAPSEFGNMRIEFTGRDSGFWAGYYGPMVRDIDVRLRYTVAPVDPCVSDPQSSPSCPGYTIISDNLVPFPNHWTTNGQTINQTYAINQALSSAGAGIIIHGFNYGYQYNLGSSWTQCTWVNNGVCVQTQTFNPRVDVNLSIRSNTNTQLYGITHTEIGVNTGNQRRDFQYRFDNPRDILTLGNFNYTASTSQNATVFGMYSRAAYTIDECAANPLSSTTCPGYEQAFFDQQCSANALYSSQCPGYAQAFFDQQCGLNALHSPSCPGYAQAYFDQQCSLNTLYDPACPGYAQAFYNYQCSLNSLYHTGCPGYAQAYFDQQCGLDPLYNNQCPGYAQAYFDQQCGLDPLYNNQCPGYADAFYVQQCTISPLYDSGCTGYAQAYYDQQCSISALYDSGCPGYDQAFYSQQCSLDALYDKGCPGYSEAYAKKYILNIGSTAPVIAVEENKPVAVVAEAEPAKVETKVEEKVTVAATETREAAVSASPAAQATAPVSLAAAPAASPATASRTEARTEAPRTAAPARAAPTTRQALAEQRMAAAREQAAQAARENPGETTAAMDSAGSMEQQVELQNVVLGAMGFVPGFDAYGRATIPDAAGYPPFVIYPGQRNIDSPAARGLLGRSDRLHQEMVDAQYR